MKPYEKAFDALGDATRRAIFEKLAKGALPVGRLANGLPVSRPAVSQHLYVLKDAGLIRVQQLGTRNIYRLDEKGILAMRDWLDQFWDTALYNFKIAAESAEKINKKNKLKK
jgi:DNA-binding transcriptional ArsR family regulator